MAPSKTVKKEKKVNKFEGRDPFSDLESGISIPKEDHEQFKSALIKRLGQELSTIVFLTKLFAKGKGIKEVTHQDRVITREQYTKIISIYRDHLRLLVRKPLKKYRDKYRPFFKITKEFASFLANAFEGDFKNAVSQFAKEQKIPKVLMGKILYHYIGIHNLRINGEDNKIKNTKFHPDKTMLKYLGETFKQLQANCVEKGHMEDGKLDTNTQFPHYSVFSIISLIGTKIVVEKETQEQDYAKLMKTFGKSIEATEGLIQDSKNERAENAKAEAGDKPKPQRGGKKVNKKEESEEEEEEEEKPAKGKKTSKKEEPEEEEEEEEEEQKPAKGGKGSRVATTPPSRRRRAQSQSDDEDEE